MQTSTIYRGFNLQELNSQYRVIDTVDNPKAVMQQAIEESKALRSQTQCQLDLRFGPTKDEVCDIFFASEKNAPLHVFIHGGYWYQFTKNEFSFIAKELVKAGINVVVPTYSLCPKVTVSEIVRQMRALIAWLYKNASSFQADPQKIYLSGHSAGGHLVGMLCATPWPDEYQLPANLLKGATALSGIFDLEPITHVYLQEYVGLSYREVAELSPMHHIPTNTSTPLLIGVGEKETDEFKRQTTDYAELWKKKGNTVSNIPLPNHDHLSLLWDYNNINSGLYRQLIAQMQQK